MHKSSCVIISLSSALLSSAFLAPVSAAAASFDCNKAGTWVEKTICSQPELSRLDEVMAKQYKAKLATATDYEDSNAFKRAARNDQRNWLRFRRNTCNSEQCLIREYKERDGEQIGRYFNHLDQAEWPNGRSYGTFFETSNIATYDAETQTWDAPIAIKNSIAIDQIKAKPNMALVDGSLFFTNAHTCHIDAEVARWYQNHWVISDQQTDAELRLYPARSRGKTQILFRDIDHSYKNSHCGMRGYFDGKVLTSK